MLVRARSLVSTHSLVHPLAAGLFFAAFTILAAKIALPLWFTPVPITLQVVAALLAGLVLGPRLGAISQVEYLAIGLAGAPVFAGGKAGLAALAGPTGGYLVGLVVLAFITGAVYEAFGSTGKMRAIIASLCGVTALYICGFTWLAFWLGPANGESFVALLGRAFALGVAPFIVVDVIKAVVGAMVLQSGKRLLSWLR